MGELSYFLNADLNSITPDLLMRVKKAYPNFTDGQAQEMINAVNQADPTTTQGSYTSWLINQIIKKNLPDQFNTEEIKKTLQLFHTNKTRPIWTAPKDISKFTWQTLNDSINSIEGLRSESGSLTEHPAAPKETKGIKKVYDKDGWQVYEISTVEALMDIYQKELHGA